MGGAFDSPKEANQGLRKLSTTPVKSPNTPKIMTPVELPWKNETKANKKAIGAAPITGMNEKIRVVKKT